jgi:hypothetical protein
MELEIIMLSEITKPVSERQTPHVFFHKQSLRFFFFLKKTGNYKQAQW